MAAWKEFLTHIPFRFHLQHMFGMGAEPAWSMNTCYLSFEFVSKRFHWELMMASAALEVRAAVRFVDPAGAAAAGDAVATGRLTLLLR